MMIHLSGRRSGFVTHGQILTMMCFFLVMMQLGVVDFLAFSGVCKSWRLLALSNRDSFMVSKPPMSVHVFDANENECHLKDFEGRKWKTILPHSAGRTCIGVTCGYLILFGEKTHDFWLVNPITRHGLHFPDVPFRVGGCHDAILVFSPSISGWVFVVSGRYYYDKIWFSIAGKREWTFVPTPFRVRGLQAFKGKIYTLSDNHLCEVALYPTPKVTLLEIKKFPKQSFYIPLFVSSAENLYVLHSLSEHSYKIHQLDFGKMKWVLREKIEDECVFFCSDLKYGADVTLVESWADLYPQYGHTNESGKCRVFNAKMWYFFHDCSNLNRLHE